MKANRVEKREINVHLFQDSGGWVPQQEVSFGGGLGPQERVVVCVFGGGRVPQEDTFFWWVPLGPNASQKFKI